MPRQRHTARSTEQATTELSTIGFYGAIIIVPLIALFLALDPLRNTDMFIVYILFLALSFPLFLFTKVEVQINMPKAVVIIAYGLIFGGILILTQQFVSITMSAWERSLNVGLAPFAEELFFRGLILGAFLANRNRVAIMVGLFVSSFAFAVFHFYAYNIADPGMFMVLFSGGIVLGLALVVTRSIDVCIVAHFMNNALALVTVAATCTAVIL